MYRGLTFLLAAAVAAAPAHAADDSPICPDRPSKGTGTCTVPAGHWQIESGLIDWTHDTNDGVRSDLTVIAASLVKFGIADDADLEIGVVPWEISRVRGPGGRERGSGFGDMLVRGKVRLTGGTARLQVALDPFVKVPTAKHDLGNGKVEGGVTVLAGMSLGGPLSIAIAPEVDWRANGDGQGYHAAMVQLVDVGIAATPQLSLTAELWGSWDWDPAGTTRQYSADGAVAYLLSNSIQLDAGANFGLNRNTPDVELYAGVSKRF